MWPFGEKRGGSAALTPEQIEALNTIIKNQRKAEDPFTSAALDQQITPAATTEIHGGQKEVTVPRVTVINVPPVEQRSFFSPMNVAKPIIALTLIGATGIAVICAIIELFVLMGGGLIGAVMIYIAGFYIFLATTVLAIILFMYYRIRLKPVWIYKDAVGKTGKALMLLWRKTGVVSLELARYVAETFEREANPVKGEDPLAFFKTDSAPGVMGQAGIGVFFDAANVMANPEFVLACAELRRQGYRDIEQAKRDWLDGKLKVNVPLFMEVDFTSLYHFITGRPAIIKAYCDTKVNEARAERDQKFYQNPQVMMLGFLMIMGVIALGLAKAFGLF